MSIWWPAQRRLSLPALAAAALCALLGVLSYWSGALDWAERKVLDAQFRIARTNPQPVTTDVVVVGIDEDFLRAIDEPVALLHGHYASLFEALARARPRLVGMDIVFPQKSYAFLAPVNNPSYDYDVALARGLLKLGAVAPVVIGKSWEGAAGRFRQIHPAFVAAAARSLDGRAPEGFDNRGSAMVCANSDEVVRDYPGRSCQPDGGGDTLTARMAALSGRHGEWEGLVNWGIGGAFSYVPARELTGAAPDPLRLATLKDKVVLIGSVLDFEDRHKLPVALAQWEPGNTMLPGVLLQAQILRSLLNQGLVRPTPAALPLALIALGGLFFVGSGTLRKLSWFAAFTVALLGLSAWLLRQGMYLPLVTPLATAALALGGSAALAARRDRRERRYLQRTFAGYVSPQVLKGILSGAIAPGKAGEKRRVCVLFSDIRDFTTISESLPPDVVVGLLNRYFDRMASIVHRYGGTVDKFIGDAVMALFGAPQALDGAERSALAAAQEMLLALAELNREFRQQDLPELRIGIGLHSGEAIIGHVGSSARHEYTAIGDTVNVAARIADLPKTIGYPIACSEAVVQAIAPGGMVDVGVRELKGHSAMRIYGCGEGCESKEKA